jgi:hypothetical protein
MVNDEGQLRKNSSPERRTTIMIYRGLVIGWTPENNLGSSLKAVIDFLSCEC